MPGKPIRPDHVSEHPVGLLARECGLSLVTGSPDATVSGVSLASSQVLPGDLFVALPGRVHHGSRFAKEAVSHGAAAILTDQDGAAACSDLSVPVLVVAEPRTVLGSVSQLIYHPGMPLPKILAVTGTNGKTSTTFYIEAIFRALGHHTALSNSAERRVAGESFHTPLTTPEAPELQALLALAATRSVSVMALEASAQAIERHRLQSIVADVAGFTNLSHDHFEDYGDMDRYLAQKLPLFQPNMARRAVISLESEWGQKVVERAGVPLVSVSGADDIAADWHFEWADLGAEGERVLIRGPKGELETRISAWGEHMVRNAVLACVMAVESGVSLNELQAAIGPATPGIDVVIPGRLEKVSGPSPVLVFVDAGRSADAYLNTFSTLRRHGKGRLIVVCGTSGNRDRSKRPVMGEIAASTADLVIVTDDDPRFEDPAQIRADLLEGALSIPAASVKEIADPDEAIDFAVSSARPGDIVVWMGPGSQYYREIQGVRYPYSAREQAKRALVRAGYDIGSGAESA